MPTKKKTSGGRPTLKLRTDKRKKVIKKGKSVSELRMDLVSNDWVIVATGRARRPETFATGNRVTEQRIHKKECPFCGDKVLDQGVTYRLDKPDGRWSTVAVKNKFPALSEGVKTNERKDGPNRIMDGIGFHEVIITWAHDRQMAQFTKAEIKEVVDVYQQRYLDLMNKKFIKYVSIFHNHGKEAGASIFHPHSQLIAIPVVDPHLRTSLEGAERYFTSQGKCVYCIMLEWDLKNKERIVYENERFVALCPFASQMSFEVRIYPKDHHAYFERMDDPVKWDFSDALQKTLSKIFVGLKDPPYNFYLHTAPCDGANYDHYHWHLIIAPKTSTYAGFEMGTGIEISTIEPEQAAKFLRKF
jgi:UDPglucose--hexose-1-phosphate uridylyltransferase